MGGQTIENGTDICLRDAWRNAQSGHFFHLLFTAKEQQTSTLPEGNERTTDLFQKSLRSVLQQEPTILSQLPNETLAMVGNWISMGDNTDKSLIDTLNQNYEVASDHGYRSWELSRRADFLRALVSDPVVRDAQTRWNDPAFSLEDKMHLAERVGVIQAGVYGYTPVRLTTYSENDGANGRYSSNSRDKRIEINTYSANGFTPTILGNFDAFMGTVAHENDHAFQDMAATRYLALQGAEYKWQDDHGVIEANMTPEQRELYKSDMRKWVDENLPQGLESAVNRELLPDGRLVQFASVMLSQRNTYISSEINGSDGYTHNPTEVQAEDLGFYTRVFFDPSAALPQSEQIEFIRWQQRQENQQDLAQCSGRQAVSPSAPTTPVSAPAPAIGS